MDKLQNPFMTAVAAETPLLAKAPNVEWREQVAEIDRATPKTLLLRRMRAKG